MGLLFVFVVVCFGVCFADCCCWWWWWWACKSAFCTCRFEAPPQLMLCATQFVIISILHVLFSDATLGHVVCHPVCYNQHFARAVFRRHLRSCCVHIVCYNPYFVRAVCRHHPGLCGVPVRRDQDARVHLVGNSLLRHAGHSGSGQSGGDSNDKVSMMVRNNLRNSYNNNNRGIATAVATIITTEE